MLELSNKYETLQSLSEDSPAKTYKTLKRAPVGPIHTTSEYVTTQQTIRKNLYQQKKEPTVGQVKSDYTRKDVKALSWSKQKQHQRLGYQKRLTSMSLPGGAHNIHEVSPFLDHVATPNMTEWERLELYSRRHKCSHNRFYNHINLKSNSTRFYEVSCDHDYETLERSQTPKRCFMCSSLETMTIKKPCSHQAFYCTKCTRAWYKNLHDDSYTLSEIHAKEQLTLKLEMLQLMKDTGLNQSDLNIKTYKNVVKASSWLKTLKSTQEKQANAWTSNNQRTMAQVVKNDNTPLMETIMQNLEKATSQGGAVSTATDTVKSAMLGFKDSIIKQLTKVRDAILHTIETSLDNVVGRYVKRFLKFVNRILDFIMKVFNSQMFELLVGIQSVYNLVYGDKFQKATAIMNIIMIVARLWSTTSSKDIIDCWNTGITHGTEAGQMARQYIEDAKKKIKSKVYPDGKTPNVLQKALKYFRRDKKIASQAALEKQIPIPQNEQQEQELEIVKSKSYLAYRRKQEPEYERANNPFEDDIDSTKLIKIASTFNYLGIVNARTIKEMENELEKHYKCNGNLIMQQWVLENQDIIDALKQKSSKIFKEHYDIISKQYNDDENHNIDITSRYVTENVSNVLLGFTQDEKIKGIMNSEKVTKESFGIDSICGFFCSFFKGKDSFLNKPFRAMVVEILPFIALTGGVMNIVQKIYPILVKFFERITGTQDDKLWLQQQLRKKNSNGFNYMTQILKIQYHTAKQDDIGRSQAMVLKEQYKLAFQAQATQENHMSTHFLTFIKNSEQSITGALSPDSLPEPFCIKIYSGPGKGKSTVWPTLVSSIFGFADADAIKKTTYYRGTEEFWDGCGGKKIVMYDDFGQNIDTEQDILELINVVSAGSFMPPISTNVGESRKGMQYKPEVVVCCTNQQTFAPKRISNPLAVNRRFHVDIMMNDHNSFTCFKPKLYEIAESRGHARTKLDDKFDETGNKVLYNKKDTMDLEQVCEYIYSCFVRHKDMQTLMKNQETEKIVTMRTKFQLDDKYTIKLDTIDDTIIDREYKITKQSADLIDQAMAVFSIVGYFTIDHMITVVPFLNAAFFGAKAIMEMRESATSWDRLLIGIKNLLFSFVVPAVIGLAIGILFFRSRAESGTTKTAKSTAPALAVAQSALSDSMDNKLRNNIVTITNTKTNETVNGYFVEGRWLMTVDHIFLDNDRTRDYVEKGTKFILTKPNRDSTITFDYDPLRRKRIGTKDINFYLVDKHLTNNHKTITNQFWDGTHTLEGTTVHAHTLNYKKEHEFNYGKVLTDQKRCYYEGNNVSYTHSYVECDYTSSAGHCGGIISNDSERPFLGIHVAAIDRNGHSLFLLVTKEMIRSVVGENNVNGATLDDELSRATPQASSFISGDMEAMGVMNRPLYQPTNSSLEPSLVYEALQEHTTEPAVLSKHDKRLTEPIDMDVIGTKKFREIGKGFDIETVKEVTLDMRKDIMQYNTGIVHRILTLDEAINGIPEYGFKSIDMSTSAGYPYSITGITKDQLFTRQNDRLIPTARFITDYNSTMELLRKGQVPNWYNLCTYKDERVSKKKIYVNVKTRLFSVAPIMQTIIGRQYFGTYLCQVLKTHDKTWHSVGLDRTGIDWDVHFRRLLEAGSEGFGLDYEFFDGRMPPEISYEVFWNERSVEVMTPSDELVVETLITSMVEPLYVLRDKIFQVKGSEASGLFMTTVHNSDVGECFLRYSWKKNAPLIYAGMRHYKNATRSAILGDDNAVAVRREMQEYFNAVKVRDTLKEKGITCTAPDKSDNMIPISQLMEVSFLKNTTRIMDDLYVPIMEEKALLEMTNWIRVSKQQPSKLKATEDNCNCMLRSAFFYGRQYYQGLVDKLMEREPRLQLEQYTDLYNIFRRFGHFPGTQSDMPTHGEMKGEFMDEEEAEDKYALYAYKNDDTMEKATIQTGIHCTMCGKISKSNNELIRHMLSHQDHEAIHIRCENIFELKERIDTFSIPIMKKYYSVLQLVLSRNMTQIDEFTHNVIELGLSKDVYQYLSVSLCEYKKHTELEKATRQSTWAAQMDDIAPITDADVPEKSFLEHFQAPITELSPVSTTEKIGKLDATESDVTSNNKLGFTLNEKVPENKNTLVMNKNVSYAPNRAELSLNDMSWNLVNMLKKFTQVKVLEWKITDVQGSSLNIMDILNDVLGNSFIAQPFFLFTYFRCKKISLRFILTGSKFHQGRLLVSFQPTMLNTRSVDTRCDIQDALALGGFQLDPSVGSNTDIDIPFIFNKGFMNLLDADALGQVHVFVLNQLQAVSGASTSVQVRVLISIEEAEFKVPRPTNTTFSAMLSDYSKKDFIERASRQSMVDNLIGNILDEIVPEKLIVDFVGALLDKPQITLAPVPMKLRPMSYMNHSAGPEFIDKLQLQQKAQQLVDKEHFGTKSDHMNFNGLLRSKRTLVGQGKWLTTDGVGTQIFNLAVGPMAEVERVGSAQKLSLFSYLHKNKYAWRGGITYTIDFVTSYFHEGKVDIAFHPARQQGPIDYENAVSQYVSSFPIKNDNNIFQVTVPYLSETPYRKVYNGIPISDSYTDDASDRFVDYFNGSISIIVANPLRVPSTVVPQVDFNVYIQASSDYEVNVITVKNSSLKSEVAARATAQSGKAQATTVSQNKNEGTVLAPVRALTSDPVTRHYGEIHTSFREEMKAFTWVKSTTQAISPGSRTIEKVSIVDLLSESKYYDFMRMFRAYRGPISIKITLSSFSVDNTKYRGEVHYTQEDITDIDPVISSTSYGNNIPFHMYNTEHPAEFSIPHSSVYPITLNDLGIPPSRYEGGKFEHRILWNVLYNDNSVEANFVVNYYIALGDETAYGIFLQYPRIQIQTNFDYWLTTRTSQQQQHNKQTPTKKILHTL